MSLNQQTKKTTFIPLEFLEAEIEVIYTNNVANLTKFVNEMPIEYRNLLTKEKLLNDSPKIELKLDKCDYFLDYFFYTVDNDLEKYKIIITQKPKENDMSNLVSLCADLLDDILECEGMDIAPTPGQERQLRNVIVGYIFAKTWKFCTNKLNEV